MLLRSFQCLPMDPWTRLSSGHPFCTYCITILSVSWFLNLERISPNSWSRQVMSLAHHSYSTWRGSFHDSGFLALPSWGDRHNEPAVQRRLPGKRAVAKSNPMNLILNRSISLVENNRFIQIRNSSQCSSAMWYVAPLFRFGHSQVLSRPLIW